MIDSKIILEKIIPNKLLFFTHLLTFLILFLATLYLVYKPMENFLEKRNNYIKNNIDNSVKNNELSKNNFKESQIILINAQEKAKKIIFDAQEKGEIIYTKIVEKAKEDAGNEFKKIDKNIQIKIKNANKEIHDQIVKIALLVCRKILNREVNENDNKKYINDCVSELLKD